LGGSVEGVVEKIRLRTTTIRARSGEPIIVPNGEVRAIRNFSRANYSESKIKIHIRSKDARKAVDLLEAMSNDAVMLFENLIEPWRVLSETGEIGSQTVLTVAFRSKFGKAAIVRPKLLYIIQEKFEAANILLEN
ncbi:MAG: small-conductance mechanosensitive channel, partial [Cellvibrionaceae bacterium]